MKRILVPLDGSYLAERAANYAAPLARHWHASVELFHWTPPGAIGRAPVDEREAGMQMDALAASLRRDGVSVETVIDHLAHGNLAEAVAEAITSRSAELVVMATRGQAGIGEALFGSQAEQVFREVDVPVLVVPGSGSGAWTKPRVLVPLDGTEASEGALDPAVRIAADFGGEIILARIVDTAMGTGDAGALTRAMDHARRYLSEVAGKLQGSAIPVQQVVELGRLGDALDRIAGSQRADLIVMGTHARQGFLRLLQGSDTEAVVNQASLPILVVPGRPA